MVFERAVADGYASATWLRTTKAVSVQGRFEMYEEFFHLSANPFAMAPDPHCLLLTSGHRSALEAIMNAVARRKGMVLLLGGAGTGKTTLLAALVESVPPELACFALLRHPTLNADEFLEMLLLELGIRDLPATKPRRLLALERFTLRANTEGKIIVVLIDEAHRLALEVLEEVRLLANLETREGKLLQIVLAGHNSLEAQLGREPLQPLKQRVACRAILQPLAPAESGAYVNFRWARAGGVGPAPFAEDAIDYLGLFSGGVPRVINELCDNALELMCSQGAAEVWPEHIVAAAKALTGEIATEEAGAAADGGPHLFRVYEGAGRRPWRIPPQ